MTPEKGRYIVARYRSFLGHLPKGEGPFDRKPTPQEAMTHLHGMLDKMEGFLDTVDKRGSEWELEWDKFNRWLGFMQGAFWLHGDYVLDQMRDHNRTKEVVVHGDFGALIEEEKSQ